jgi:phage gpG-like protein
MLDGEIKGLEATQRRLARLVQETSANDGLLGIVAKATLRAHRYATQIVHVLTARLKNSLFPRTSTRRNQAYGVVGTNVVYARVEHERGGNHAYFRRTIDEEGPGIVAMWERDVAAMARRAGE